MFCVTQIWLLVLPCLQLLLVLLVLRNPEKSGSLQAKITISFMQSEQARRAKTLIATYSGCN